MGGLELLHEPRWNPLARFGLTHSFFNIDYMTVVYTWIVLLAIVLLLVPIYFILKRKPNLLHFMITSFVNYFVKLSNQSFGRFIFKHFAFVTSLFIFILMCNLISVIPWREEPTKNINTTLAFGLASFLYIHYYSIKAHGAWEYIKEYFRPIPIMFPLNVVGKIANVLSISFRLFGNIFGGVIIGQIWLSAIKGSIIFETVGILTGINLIITGFFGLFEGLLQAFVFMMLTMTYLSIEAQSEQPQESGERIPDSPGPQESGEAA